MENSLKGLLLAAGTIITCIVISLGFFIAREARDTATDGAGQISKLNAEFNESDKVMYDGMMVSGSEVVNVINKFRNNMLSITVHTKLSDISYNYHLKKVDNGTSEADWRLGDESASKGYTAMELDNAGYINPNAQFRGEVIRDRNQVIIGIVFTQAT
ncbi:MAG: hypothetical protein IKL07_10810 [Clostridium sp.]|nr:hypothetical protein [Clostridium sp.]